MGMLGYYIEPIFGAIIAFPLVALIFTLPFVIVNYRRYGGIAVMRVMVVYSFILYCMCAYLLTVLPLPDPEAVAQMAPHPIGWIPFRDLYKAMIESGLSPADPSSFANLDAWKRFLTCADMFQAVANIAMLVPLGFYLRYYFRLSFGKTVAIGLCVSLFFELTQLSGLYGIYPHPYRFTEMDDLINNTLGAALGYALAPIAMHFLPSRDEIDRISYEKGENATLSRKIFALAIDMMLFSAIVVAMTYLLLDWDANYRLAAGIGLFVLYFAALPRAMGGRTFGQAILKLRTMDEHAIKTASFMQLLGRNVLLYAVEPFAIFIGVQFVGVFAVILFAEYVELWLRIVGGAFSLAVPLGVLWFFLYVQREWGTFPHGHYSHTIVIADNSSAGDETSRGRGR